MKELLSPAQATERGFISLQDAAAITGEDRTNLWRKAKAGKIPNCLVSKGVRPVAWVLKSALGLKVSATKSNDYERLKDQFLQQMRSGAFTGKPESKKYVEGVLDYGLRKYWTILSAEPTIAGVSVENYIRVMDSPQFQVDEVNRRDHYSNKTHVYRACTRFIDFLIKQGLKSKADKDGFTPPKRHFKPQKRMLEEELIHETLAFNRAWYDGRKQFDVESTDLLIHLYAFGGLRKMGAASLRISDIDFDNDLMLVMEKGCKERYVPLNLFPELKPKLQDWIRNIRPENSSDLLILQDNGKPLTESSINQRFTRLRQAMNYRKAEVKLRAELAEKGEELSPKELKQQAKVLAKQMKGGIRPHDLRRSFATILAKRGMPMSMIQLILGHEDLKTTQGYVLTNIQQVMDWTKARTSAPQIKKKEEAFNRRVLFDTINKQAMA